MVVNIILAITRVSFLNSYLSELHSVLKQIPTVYIIILYMFRPIRDWNLRILIVGPKSYVLPTELAGLNLAKQLIT